MNLGVGNVSHYIGNGIYESEADTKISVRLFISGQNTKPKTISDDAFITSVTGKKIKLRFVRGIHTLRTLSANSSRPRNDTLYLDDFFKYGVNIGNVKVDPINAFFLQVTFWVVEGNPSKYDLYMRKTVNNGKEEDTANIGDILKYKLYVKNKSYSNGTPSNIFIYDDYDEKKLLIVQSSLSKACKDDGSVITCHIPNSIDISPGKSIVTTYSAIIKKGAIGTIMNTAKVRINPDYDTDKGNNEDSVIVTIKE